MAFPRKSIFPFIKKSLRNGWAFRLIGIVVFIFILYKINLGELLRTIGQIDPYWLAFSLIPQGIALIIATFRWKLVMENLEIHVPYGPTFIHQLTGTGMALVTPGQLGEFVKVLYHRNLGFPVPESALSVVIDRLYDLAMLLLFGLISLAILFGISPELATGLAIAGSLLALATFYYVRNKEKSARLFVAALVRISPEPYKDTIEQNAHRLIGRVGSLTPTFLLACMILSLGNYTFLVMRFYVLALAVHMQISFWYVALAVPLLRLAGLIPISVSGIGTRDAVLIYLLYKVGIPPEKSLALSLLGLTTIVFQALVGVLLWSRYPPQLFGEVDLPKGQLLADVETDPPE